MQYGAFARKSVPVTPSRVSTVLARSCLIFQSDISSKKGPVAASLQRPSHCYGSIASTEFLLAIHCDLTTRSLRFHGTHNACTVLSWRSHCADGVLKTQWHLQERHTNVQYPCKRHGLPRHLHNDPCARTRSSYCVGGDLTARLWRPTGDPIAVLLEYRTMAFVLSMLKVHAVIRRTM